VDSAFVDRDGASRIDGGVAVVIDVMRAFTLAAYALGCGAERMILVDDIEEAVRVAARTSAAMLCKDGAPDPRFDLTNSPRQLLDRDVSGRSIVQRTGAGTRAAVAARRADVLLCASFVCATATARMIHQLDPEHVSFVVSGGLEAEEDLACAELIAHTSGGEQPDPIPYLARAVKSAAAADLELGAKRKYPGVAVEDVAMCCELDRFDFAMYADTTSEHVTLRAAKPLLFSTGARDDRNGAGRHGERPRGLTRMRPTCL
jgi:2-phosphosulfolactate phosphatase